jgi:uncharacterized membrane protein YhaH (DUF805 family)
VIKLIELFFDPRGTIGRLPYISVVGLLAVLFFVLFIVRHFEDDQRLFAISAILALAYSLACLVTKRNRDTGSSLWRVALLIFPGINLIFVLFLWLPSSKVP